MTKQGEITDVFVASGFDDAQLLLPNALLSINIVYSILSNLSYLCLTFSKESTRFASFSFTPLTLCGNRELRAASLDWFFKSS